MPKNLTTDDFIQKSNEIHNFKYDYSLVEYKNNRTSVSIICPEHGIFEQLPMNHIKGFGCSKCSKNKPLTTIEFIKKANETHNNKYDYSLTIYDRSYIKVKIICPEHGIFEQKPNNHLTGAGCPKCNDGILKDKENFIEKAKNAHNNKYDYSLVEYINMNTNVKIICPIHGIFEQRPSHHLMGHGCPLCGVLKNKEQSFSINEFIEKVKELHHNQYDYSLVEYVNNYTKIKIICPEHGEFEQMPKIHFYYGCPKCKKERLISKYKNNFIEKATNKHQTKYDYSLIKYKNSHTKIEIICPEHGIFKQTPQHHLKGHGCPLCGNKSKRLKRIKKISEDKFNGNQIIPSYNKTFCEYLDKMINISGIFIQHAMNGGEYHIKELGYWLDGYDKENNIAYEFDEKHHFNKDGTLKEKDIIRQQEIEKYLGCKFIRIKK